ncbi:MAG: RNA-binding S4 domain-containing protein [Nanoarchaeota archaeon]
MTDRYVELNAFLRRYGKLATGGQAKKMIQSGMIAVNGMIETRNKRKLHAGDVVSLGDERWSVTSEDTRQS